jgi:flagellar transcriptional activator FlhC
VSQLLFAKSSSGDEQENARASALVKLGAQLQVLESATKLPRERLLRLYKDIHKKSLPTQMAPIAMDWFMNWQPNTHASLFLNLYACLEQVSRLDEVETLVRSYRVYQEQLRVLDLPEVLSVTHAWRLVKFVDSGILALTPCTRCQAAFVVPTPDLHEMFVCLLCRTSSRSGTGARVHRLN